MISLSTKVYFSFTLTSLPTIWGSTEVNDQNKRLIHAYLTINGFLDEIALHPRHECFKSSFAHNIFFIIITIYNDWSLLLDLK